MFKGEVKILPGFKHTVSLSPLNPVFGCKTKISNFFLAPTWRFKSRRNKKRIATAACKSRDESNESN